MKSGKSHGILILRPNVTPQFQLNDLSFCQNAKSRSHGKLCEVREKSGQSQQK